MTHSVEHHLSVTPEAYDVEIRRFIPGYDAMLDEVAAALVRRESPSDGVLRVLDLGAGTGGLSDRVATRVARASITMLDEDAAMLRRAEERLGPHAARVRVHRGSFAAQLPPCDVAVASLALHHVRDADAKREVYRNIRGALAPGGLLVNADATIPRDPSLAASAWARWAAHLVANGDTEAQAYARFEDWAKEDRYFAVDEELEMLRGAGFRSVEVLWRVGPLSVLAAAT